MTGVLIADDALWMKRQQKVARSVAQKAVENDGIAAKSRDNLVVRPLLPAQDLDSGSENGWPDATNANPDHEWRQDFTTGGATADAYNEAYSIDSNSLAEQKILGIYGVSILHTTVETRQIKFRYGGPGEVMSEINIEAVENDEQSRGLFPNNYYFDLNTSGSIEFWVDAAQDSNRIALHGWVAEDVEETYGFAQYPDFCDESLSNTSLSV